VEAEKPLSDRLKFIKSYLEQGKTSSITPPAPKARTYQLDELVAGGKTIRRDFSYDSETARNFDDSNVKKAKIGVKELIKDAIDKAKSQVTRIKEEAHKEGFDAGFIEGLKAAETAAKTDFDPFLKTLEETIHQLSWFRKEMYSKVEREMIEMVIHLTKKIIHFELSTREDAVQEMIRLGVQSVLDKESMVIKINPEDKGYAESFRPELHHMFGEIKNITFEAHSGIQRGGCLIETNFGTVDARLEKLNDQLERILNLAPAPIENPVDLELESGPEEPAES